MAKRTRIVGRMRGLSAVCLALVAGWTCETDAQTCALAGAYLGVVGVAIVPPRPVSKYPPGTRVVYCANSSSNDNRPYVLPRKAADRVISITNRIKPHPRPVAMGRVTFAPVGSFTVGESWIHLHRIGYLADPAFQGVSDPVLKTLIKTLKANRWKMDDRVFQAWVEALEQDARKSENRHGSGGKKVTTIDTSERAQQTKGK